MTDHIRGGTVSLGALLGEIDVDAPEGILDALKSARAHGTRVSDVHLDAGEPMAMRIDGELECPGDQIISTATIKHFVEKIAADGPESSELQREGSATIIHDEKDTGMLRIFVARTLSGYSLAIRLLPSEPPELEDLGLPEVFNDIVARSSGLSLVCGPTGSGKSHALAAVTQRINRDQAKVVYTLDEGVEFRYKSLRSRIRQLRIGKGMDAETYDRALISLLRGDPDVVVVSECRTPESILACIQLAEMGKRVLTTIHLDAATGVVDRIVGAFRADMQPMVKTSLAAVLADVVVMRLPRRITPTDRYGRVVATEVLTRADGLTSAILDTTAAESVEAGLKNFITSHDTDATGMHLMEKNLETLVKEKVIDRTQAFDVAIRPKELQDLIGSREQDDAPKGFRLQ